MTWWETMGAVFLFLALVPPAAMAGINGHQQWLKDCELHRMRRPIVGYIVGGLFNYIAYVSGVSALLAVLFGVGFLLFALAAIALQ